MNWRRASSLIGTSPALARTGGAAAKLAEADTALTTWAAEPPKPAAPVDLDKLVGQPVLDVSGRPVDAFFKAQCAQAGMPIDKQTNLVWKRIELLIEWGFKKGTEALPFDDETWGAKAKVMKENIEHHIEEEEGEMFRQARQAFDRDELEDLGRRMAERKASAARELGIPVMTAQG